MRRIGNEDFYPLKTAAETLDISESKLREGLHSGRFPFRWAKDGDLVSSPIFVAAKDVEVWKRQKDKAFLQRLRLNAGV